MEKETVTCECGKEVPVELARIDEGGCWWCPDCLAEMQSEEEVTPNH